MSIKPWHGLVLVILIIVIPLFSHIDDMCMQMWDEGRLANSAFEMYKTGDPIVVTYGYEPEMWSTKPPLLIWLQALSLHILGINDLAIRMPSALSAFCTCIFLYWFSARKLKIPWVGILAALVLVTTPGYVMLHGVRTADYDGPLALFTTMYCIYYLLFLKEQNRKYFWLFIITLICATLTKGIAGLLFLPGLFIYTLYKKKLISVLKSPITYLGIVTFMVLVGGYYLLREHYKPGYWAAVAENELGGRFSKAVEGHNYEILHYFKYIISDGYKPWYLLSILGCVIGIFSQNRLIKDTAIGTLTLSLSQLIILSIGATKLYWYALPIFPLMSLPVAIGIYSIANILYNSDWGKKYFSQKILPYLFIIVVCAAPAMSMVDYVMLPHGDSNKGNDIGKILKTIMREGYRFDHTLRVVNYEYQSGVEWYVKALQEYNYPVEQGDTRGLKEGYLVVMYDDGAKKEIEDTYKTHIVATEGSATIYQVHGRK